MNEKTSLLLIPSYIGRSRELLLAQLSSTDKLHKLSISPWGHWILVQTPYFMECLEYLRNVSGLSLVALGNKVKSLEEAATMLKSVIANSSIRARFGVKVFVQGKDFAYSVDEELSTQLQAGLAEIQVRQAKEKNFYIFKQAKFYFVSKLHYPGRGGLTAGINGKALCLFSGGEGSICAAIEVMKAGFQPVLLKVISSIESPEMRSVVASACYINDLTLNETELLVYLAKGRNKEASDKHKILKETAEMVARSEGLSVICTGVHASERLQDFLNLYNSSQFRYIHPVLTWDDLQLSSSLPREVRRRLFSGRERSFPEDGNGHLLRIKLQSFAQYNNSLDTLLRAGRGLKD